MSLQKLVLTLLGIAILAWPVAPIAQEPGDPSNPRAAMLGYLEACRAGDYRAGASFLALAGRPLEEGARLARHLKFVLDQKLWIEPEALSEDPDGDPSDGLASRDLVGVIESQSGPVEIWLERDPSTGEWLIAQATVARIEALYDEFGLGPLGEVLPEQMFLRVGELELWQWTALLALVLVAYLLAVLLTTLAMRLTLRLARRTQTALDDQLLQAASGPLTATLLIGLFALGTLPLGLSVPVREFIGSAAQTLALVTLTWLAIRMLDVGAHALELRLVERGDTTALTVIPVGRRIAKVLLLVIAALTALQNLGYNVFSIIATLGVVGIAVAFAAQKTFENFFGALAMLVDKPVQRGDFCRFGDKIGTVEDIGLRSTRVRTLDRTVVTVPNAEFTSLQLENFRARDRIRFHAILGLRYETSADQLRHVLVELRRLLIRHPRVDLDPARVRFVEFGAYSLDLELYAYVNTSDWNEFLAVREDLMLQIIDVVEASGTGFAFPSQTLYVGRDDGLDGTRARAAEEQVESWRERGELCLPDFPQQSIQELEGTLRYPAEGSALAATSQTRS